MKILVGLSGGVDSAVAAYLLKEQGYDVTCAFMRNWDAMANNDILGNPDLDEEQCTQEKDYDDAKRVADHLGLQLLRVDYVKEYWDDVFTYFIEETKKGYTPNPDILCNRFVKFDAFYDFMDEHGFDKLAMGHYAIVKDGQMYKAKDKNKDQTYFLNRVKPEVLDRVLFPLGDLSKQEVREIADRINLPVADKKDSTGICFIGERDYRVFLQNYMKDAQGDIIDVDTNTVVGKHQGVMFYTIGQRHGLEISDFMGPWFVVGKDMSKNELYVGKGKDHRDLFYSKAIIDSVNLFVPEFEGTKEVSAKFRYRQKDQRVSIELVDGDIHVTMLEPVKSVTLGQEAVFYDGDLLIGGGRIDRAFDLDENEVIYDSKS